MRHLPEIVAALALTVSVSADVVAGRTHILFHDAWTPLAGAALTPLGLPVDSAAFDGDRFLLAWREAGAVRLGLFEEGATAAVATAALEAAPGAPFVRWDGRRYVVVIASEPAQLAIVSRQGVLESRTSIPGTRAIVDAAAIAPTYYAYPSYAMLLHPFGERLLVTSLRPWGYGLTTALIERDGRATEAPYWTSLFLLPQTTRTVSLPDGTVVVVSAENGVATVRVLAGPVVTGPRRRSARH